MFNGIYFVMFLYVFQLNLSSNYFQCFFLAMFLFVSALKISLRDVIDPKSFAISVFLLSFEFLNFSITYKVVSLTVAVKNIFNNLDRQKLVGHVKLGLDEKEVRGNLMASNEAVALSSEENSRPLIEKPGGKCFDTLVRDNAYSKPSLGEKPTSSFGLKKSSKSNALNTSSGDKTFPQAKENGTHRASLVKQKSSTKLSLGSKDAFEMKESPRIGGNVSTGKTTPRSKVDFEKDERVVDGVTDGEINKRLVGDKAYEKGKHGGLSKVQSEKIKTNVQNRRTHDDDVKSVPPSSSKDEYKLQREKGFCDVEEVPSKKRKVDMKSTKVSGDKPCKEASTIPQSVDHKLDSGVTKVTRRPVSCNASTLILS